MQKKLQTIIVDDDPFIHQLIQDFCINSQYAKITHQFYNPRVLIERLPFIQFDLCLLDIQMPGAEGTTLAQMLKGKSFIYITGTEATDKLKEAINTEPLDILLKPFSKKRFDHALERAHKLIGDNIEYGLFRVAESSKKIKIQISDILYVGTDDTDPRNKLLLLKGGGRYTLMDCSLDELLNVAPRLVQANRRELVSVDSITAVQHDVLSIENPVPGEKEKEITLGSIYKKELSRRFFFR